MDQKTIFQVVFLVYSGTAEKLSWCIMIIAKLFFCAVFPRCWSGNTISKPPRKKNFDASHMQGWSNPEMLILKQCHKPHLHSGLPWFAPIGIPNNKNTNKRNKVQTEPWSSKPQHQSNFIEFNRTSLPPFLIFCPFAHSHRRTDTLAILPFPCLKLQYLSGAEKREEDCSFAKKKPHSGTEYCFPFPHSSLSKIFSKCNKGS